MRKYKHPLRLTYFLFMTGYRNLHTSGDFSGHLLILSANGNICHSIHRQLITFFLFPVKPLCWCYLATALSLLSSSSPAKQVYYIQRCRRLGWCTSLYSNKTNNHNVYHIKYTVEHFLMEHKDLVLIRQVFFLTLTIWKSYLKISTWTIFCSFERNKITRCIR